MSKTIEVYKYMSFSEMSQTDPEVKAWFDGAFRPIGPYFQGRRTATGLTFEEQRLLMPELINIEPDNRAEFRKTVQDYFDSILHRVPSEGLKLEVGLEDDNLPLSESNMPINVRDYVSYRHLKGSPKVAANLEEAESNPIKTFYIVDPEIVTGETMKLNKLEDEALTNYFKFKDDVIKVDQVLTMLGVNIKEMDSQSKLLKFKSSASKNKDLSEAEQREGFTRFIDLCKDPDLGLKYMVQELIGAQVLERVGTAILIKESGQKMGDNLRETVFFLKNHKNTRVLNILKAEYQMKVKPDTSSIVEKEKESETHDTDDVDVMSLDDFAATTKKTKK